MLSKAKTDVLHFFHHKTDIVDKSANYQNWANTAVYGPVSQPIRTSNGIIQTVSKKRNPRIINKWCVYTGICYLDGYLTP